MNRYLTSPQVMDALDASERRLREWIAQGHLTSRWINGIEVVPRDSLLGLQGRLADEAFAEAEARDWLIDGIVWIVRIIWHQLRNMLTER